MRKQRRQPSFATLTDAEIVQIAQSLDGATYADIRVRVNKPRSEGGYGLHLTSDRPLEILWKRTKIVEKINTHLASGEKLTLTTFDQITAGEKRTPEEIHHAILGATYDLVTEHDNSPTQLLSLQRLADFPARAELRAAKEQRAQAAADRAQEMHLHKTALELRKETHKVQMDLRKFEHKLTMDTFHKHITTECLNLRKQALTLREKRHQDRLASPAPLREAHNSRSEQQFEGNKSEAASGTHCASLLPVPASSPISTSRDEIYETDAAPADLFATDDESSKEPLTEAEIAALIPHVISPRPLPPEVIAANLRYAEKVRTGKIIIDRSGHYIRAVELPDPAENPAPSEKPQTAEPNLRNESNEAEPSPSRDAISSTNDAVSAHPYSLEYPSENLSTLNDCALSTQAPTLTGVFSTQQPSSPISVVSVPSSSVPSVSLSPWDLASIVDAYTIRRAQEYWAWRRHIESLSNGEPHPNFITRHRHCPCGQGNASTPCPHHENKTYGEFPGWFWTISPHLSVYGKCLTFRNLPYRSPNECIPPEFIL